MIQLPGRIPILIHPLFWVFAGLIGWLYTGNLIGMLVWIVIITLSVLFHELGHAFTAIIFKQNPRIQLVALGGLTSYEGKGLKFWQQFLIVLNGPVFGFILAGIATWLLYLGIFTNQHFYNFLKVLQVVNIFWSIVNLLPVLPLDGGQLLRIALEGFFGIKGFKASLFLGMIIAVGLSFACFLYHMYLIGALFFLFAFQSFDLWRRSRFLTPTDRNEDNRQDLIQGEMALQAGKKEEAKSHFQHIRKKAKEGLLFVAATQYLAFLEFEEGKKDEAYDLLLSIKSQVTEDAQCLLHELAFEHQNYQLVADLSQICYQVYPTQNIALRNAHAFAQLNQAKPAGGWLQTAYQYGKLDLEKTLSNTAFDPVRENPTFQEFVQKFKEK